MDEIFSKDLQQGLEAARVSRLRKRSRLRIDQDGQLIPLLQLGRNGFSVAREDAPRLRGLVDVYDGGRHLFQCLITAAEEEGAEIRYDFKRATAISDRAPLDFAWSEDAPAGLITQEKR